MPTITYEGMNYTCNSGETVLQTMLRHGVDLPHACRSGICQSCLVRAVAGNPGADAQEGLTKAEIRDHLFLACCCRPETDLTIALADEPQALTGVVSAIENLSSSVVRLLIFPSSPLDYRPGQFINLLHNGLSRSYSLASLPSEDALELHIRRLPGGKFGGWIFDELQPKDKIEFTGPLGSCLYQAVSADEPLLLVGTGTGLAPLYGIARDAISRGHRGPIHLFHGALNGDGLYLVDELRALADAQPQLSYTPCVLRGEPPAGGATGAIDQTPFARFPDLTGWRVYLCGDPDMVLKLRIAARNHGASATMIHADAFLSHP